MLPKTSKYSVVLAFSVLALAHVPAWAEDKKADKPALAGTWGKKDAELKIEFADKRSMKIVPHGDSSVLAIVCSYTVEKEGRIKAEVTGFEGKGEAHKKVQEHVPVGSKFTFKWKADGDAARLDDLKGDNVEIFKSHLEGAFEQKK